MLQKIEGPLDLIAQLPTSRALTKARATLDHARQAEQAATEVLRQHLQRLRDADRWIQNDADATRAESEAIKLSAAARLTAGEVEAAKRAHGETLASHLLKHGPACLERLVEALQEAHDIARQLADVCDRAAWDGAPIPHDLSKVRRIANETQDAVVRLKR